MKTLVSYKNCTIEFDSKQNVDLKFFLEGLCHLLVGVDNENRIIELTKRLKQVAEEMRKTSQ